MKLQEILDFGKKHLSSVGDIPTFTPIRIDVAGNEADAEVLALDDHTLVLGPRGTVRLPFYRLGTREDLEVVIQLEDGSNKAVFGLARGTLEGTTKTLLIQV